MFLDVTPVIDFNSIISNVVLSLIGIVITGVGGFLMAFLKSKLSANQLGLLEDIAANVVLAVEQSTYGKDLVNEAVDKKAMAEEMMAEFLKKYGITLNAAQLDAAIESAVANTINANKLVEPPKVVEIDSGEEGPLVA